jgi:hypothetical protein
MNNDPKPSYDTAEANLFTRFEAGQQGTFVLPYSGLLFAHQPPTPAGATVETLTLLYVTHCVTIRGTQLSPLLLIIQKGRAETIRVGGGQPSGNTNTPTVREIKVVEGQSNNV